MKRIVLLFIFTAEVIHTYQGTPLDASQFIKKSEVQTKVGNLLTTLGTSTQITGSVAQSLVTRYLNECSTAAEQNCIVLLQDTTPPTTYSKLQVSMATIISFVVGGFIVFVMCKK